MTQRDKTRPRDCKHRQTSRSRSVERPTWPVWSAFALSFVFLSPPAAMSPPCPSPTPPARASSVANLPFKYRRKSFSEDNPDYYLVPPSPSLSPSRSLSLSSSPPSSPTTLATSPAGPSHLDTAAIHPPSSPTRPSAFHGYGYAYTYAPAHDYDQHHYKLPHARPYAIIPPPAVSARSSVSAASPATSDGFRPVFPSRRTPHRTSLSSFLGVHISVRAHTSLRSGLLPVCRLVSPAVRLLRRLVPVLYPDIGSDQPMTPAPTHRVLRPAKFPRHCRVLQNAERVLCERPALMQSRTHQIHGICSSSHSAYISARRYNSLDALSDALSPPLALTSRDTDPAHVPLPPRR